MAVDSVRVTPKYCPMISSTSGRAAHVPNDSAIPDAASFPIIQSTSLMPTTTTRRGRTGSTR